MPGTSQAPSGQATPAPKAPAAELAYQYLQKGLLEGTILDGMFLSEGAIAAELGISRTPVREALLRCSFEGHIRLYPKRGALVLPVTREELEDVTELRLLIEGAVVDRACATPAVGDDLVRLVQQQEVARQDGRHAEFAAADLEFHSRLVQSGSNAVMLDVYRKLFHHRLRVSSANVAGFLRDPDRQSEIVAEHRAIAEAVARSDPEAARAAIKTHLANASRSMSARAMPAVGAAADMAWDPGATLLPDGKRNFDPVSEEALKR